MGLWLDSSLTVVDTTPIFSGPTASFDVEGYEFGLTFGNGYYFVVFPYWLTPPPEQLCGVRVRTDGIVLDTVPILIGTIYYNRQIENLLTAAGNGIYLVVFEDPATQPTSYDLYCKRVSADGQVLDSSFIVISNEYLSQIEPSVAFGDNTFIVVWQDYLCSAADIRYTRITPDGVVQNPIGIILSTAVTTHKNPACAYDGTNYLVVWTDNRNDRGPYPKKMEDIYGAIVSPEGVVLPPGIFAICNYDSIQNSADVCFGGENYFVVWKDMRNSYWVYGARVTRDGRVLDPLGIPIFTQPVDKHNPAVAFDGTNYLVVCRFGTHAIYGARVAQDGTVIDTNGFLIRRMTVPGEYKIEPIVVYNGTNYLVAWINWNSGGWDYMEGALISPDAVILDSFKFPSLPLNEIKPQRTALTTNGSDFFLAWAQQSGDVCIGTRISSDGRVLDSMGIRLGGFNPWALVFDGTDYVLLRNKENNSKLNISFINQQGVPLDTNGIDVVQIQHPLRFARMAKGPADQLLLTVANFTPDPYNTKRLYGALFNRSAITEKKI